MTIPVTLAVAATATRGYALHAPLSDLEGLSSVTGPGRVVRLTGASFLELIC